MAYLNCPSCGLILALRGPYAPIEHCPRCQADHQRLVGLFVSARPPARRESERAGRSLAANGSVHALEGR